jgi:hypothetical protein
MNSPSSCKCQDRLRETFKCCNRPVSSILIFTNSLVVASRGLIDSRIMALVIHGKTTCSICGNPILPSDEAIGFPAFLGPTHPLVKFSDAAMHAACFDKAPEKESIQKLFAEYRSVWEQRPENLTTAKEIEEWGNWPLGNSNSQIFSP